LLLIVVLSGQTEAQMIHSHLLMAPHGGHGGGGGAIHGGGFMGGVPGGFLASGIVNHPSHHSSVNPYYGVGGGMGYGYGLGYGYGYGLNYGFGYGSPLLVNNGGGMPMLWPVFAQNNLGMGGLGGRGGLMLPMPPQQAANGNAANRPRNLTRSKELVELGDRSFRGGNIKRAEDRFHQAAKLDPSAPAPHVHLAQVSLARGDYQAAADHLRDAVTVATEGGWLLNAPDIQAIYGEPADFARHLARLESHLQANPNDRDAWFVLGAENYLSGRSRQATDAFQRLSDRRPDDALAAFMDASKTKLPAPPEN
jgi:hypothetical protein